jgi:hypothetical protein
MDQISLLRKGIPRSLSLAAFWLAGACAGQAPIQQADGFVPLFDGRTLEGWVVENTDAGNFSVQDGVLHVEGPEGWLRSVREYGDFVLRVQFRFLTDDADSGIFVRVEEGTDFIRGWPGDSYQVQTRDVSMNRTTRPLLIGDLYRHRVPEGETSFDSTAAFSTFRETGEWQEFEIEVIGDRITVRLNGMPVTQAQGIVNPQGYIGIQGETGAVEYQSIAIREL